MTYFFHWLGAEAEDHHLATEAAPVQDWSCERDIQDCDE